MPVRLEGIPEGPQYLGQAIPIRLFVTAGAEPPTLDPPDVPQADLFPVGTDVRPITAGAIGTIVHETNLYRFDFVLVPRVVGNPLIPAFRARSGDRRGASPPIRLNVITPPSFGRPPWFLGGVGPIEVELAAQAEAIRLGDAALVSVRMTGQGVFGSTARPTLRGQDGRTLAAAIEPESTSLDAAPPTRTVSVRLRPSEAGTLRLAPVLVAWFDPEARRYQTVSSGSLSIRVEDPPPFDPSLIEVARLGEELKGGRDDQDRWISGFVITALGVLLLWGAWRTVRRWNRSPRRLVVRAARRLDAMHGPERADLAATAVVGFLHLATNRPKGALTPPEARDAVEQLTKDSALADRVGEMIESCDVVRYSGRGSGQQDRRQVLDAAPEILRSLARARWDGPPARVGAERLPTGVKGPSDRGRAG